MHNWWIAALEEFGLITREQAEHISEEIRLSIHKDRYKETYEELKAILEKQKVSPHYVLQDIKTDITSMRIELDKLKEQLKVAKGKKV